MNEYLALSGRIRESLQDLATVVSRAIRLRDKAEQTSDMDHWDGVALNLHGFYAGLERIFEDVARSMDRTLPEGAQWHQELLLQMSSEIASVRPAVLSRATRHCLEEYRGFRHVVRHLYTFELRPARMAQLVEQLEDCFAAVSRDLMAFADFLERLDLQAGE